MYLEFTKKAKYQGKTNSDAVCSIFLNPVSRFSVYKRLIKKSIETQAFIKKNLRLNFNLFFIIVMRAKRAKTPMANGFLSKGNKIEHIITRQPK